MNQVDAGVCTEPGCVFIVLGFKSGLTVQLMMAHHGLHRQAVAK